jgi:hypothetical protein
VSECLRYEIGRLAVVWFGPVQHGFLLNLKLDHWSGSYKSLNLEPDRYIYTEQVQRVWFRVQRFLDPELDFLLQEKKGSVHIKLCSTTSNKLYAVTLQGGAGDTVGREQAWLPWCHTLW